MTPKPPFKCLTFVSLLVSAALVGGCTSPEQPSSPPPGAAQTRAAISKTETMTATVVAINHATRRMTLRGESGPPISLTVPLEVRNLAQVERGDKVTISHYEALVAELRKPGAPESLAVRESGTRAVTGQRPGGAMVEDRTVTVRIIEVDAANDRVTFQTARGEIDTVKVRTEQGRGFIRQLRPGDRVQLTYTEAVAVTVEPVR